MGEGERLEKEKVTEKPGGGMGSDFLSSPNGSAPRPALGYSPQVLWEACKEETVFALR